MHSIPYNATINTDYVFAGWYLDSACETPISADAYVGKDGTLPIKLYAKWKLPKYTIVYNLNGGSVENAPQKYDPAEGTELPVPSREGYIFGGWYTTEAFEVGTRVEKIGKNESEAYVIYARWYAVIASTDFEGSSIDIEKASASYGGVGFNTAKERCTTKTVTDENGKYIQIGVSDYTTVNGEYTSESKAIDAITFVRSNTHNLTQMSETTLSLQFDFVYTEGTRLASATIAIATSDSAYGSITYGRLYGDTGEIKLSGSSVVIGDLMDDNGKAINGGRCTVRITVDFKNETVTAYAADGKVLDSITVKAPSKGGATSLLDWQSKATNYLFYSWLDNPKKSLKDGVNAYVGYDNFLVVDGDIFSAD